MQPECEHAEFTDAGICKSCGVDINSQEFLDSLPECPPDSQLGDIGGLIRLALATAEEFVRSVEEERDPHRPDQPKLRWVGTQLVRPTRETLWAEVIRPSFIRAKALGYRSDFERWDAICLEYVANLISKNILKL